MTEKGYKTIKNIGRLNWDGIFIQGLRALHVGVVICVMYPSLLDIIKTTDYFKYY